VVGDPAVIRPNASLGPAALVVAFLLAAASPAPAPAASIEPRASGGASFDPSVPAPAKRPLASQLSASPRETVAGDALPGLRFRIRQRGVDRVQARIVVVRLPRNAAIARIPLGWVKTGTSYKAPWPAGTRLPAGRYVVRLHVKDSRGRTLRRTARSPGRTRVTVRGRKAPPPPFVPAPATALPASTPSPAGPGVFPVAGAYTLGSSDSSFGAGRRGHIHQGHDISAAAGTPVVAPYAGSIASVDYQARGAGEYVVLDAVDGRDYFFAHCVRRSTTVAAGAAVAAGAPLCRVGRTGGVGGAHLHFEIWMVGWRVAGGFPVDPLPELLAWARR